MLKLRVIKENKDKKSLLTLNLKNREEMIIDMIPGTTMYKDHNENKLKLKQKVGDIYLMEEVIK